MAQHDEYRISRRKGKRQPWEAYGKKFSQADANTAKKTLEQKGWEVHVYRA
jgi:hypothetical protein